MKRKLSISLYALCIIVLLSTLLTLSVFATDSDSDATTQNETVDPFLEAEGDRFVSGTCGENITWTINMTTGKMMISGTGQMNFDDNLGY